MSSSSHCSPFSFSFLVIFRMINEYGKGSWRFSACRSILSVSILQAFLTPILRMFLGINLVRDLNVKWFEDKYGIYGHSEEHNRNIKITQKWIRFFILKQQYTVNYLYNFKPPIILNRNEALFLDILKGIQHSKIWRKKLELRI